MVAKTNLLRYLSVGVTWTYLASCSQADSNQIVSKKSGTNADKVLAKGGDAVSGNPTHPKEEVAVDPNAKVQNVTPKPQEPGNLEKTKADNAALLASGKLITQFNVTNPMGWGTSSKNPIVVKVPVTEAGALIVPPTLPTNQQVAGVKDSLVGDEAFAGVNSLYAGIKFCNDTNIAIQLHSSGNGPVNHGREIAAGTCQIMMVVRALANSGSTYDHKLGAGKGSVFVKLVKVLPDGSEMP
ncbi:MAG: hypothetical protein WCI18_08505 [Pseudomonadota bacterium]